MSSPSGMLQYFQNILTKVAFDVKIFEKELRKAIRTLASSEILELRVWCYAMYGETLRAILDRCFS